jgi:NAD+ kinase
MVDRSREVEALLSGAGFEVRMLEEEAAELGATDVKAVPADDTAAAGAEVVLVLGGDGTFLRAAELARPCRAPLSG